MFLKHLNWKYLLMVIVLVYGDNCFSEINNRFNHPSGLHTENQLNTMRLIILEEPGAQAYNQLISQAENFLFSIP